MNDLENSLFPIGGWEWANVKIIIFYYYITESHDILVRIGQYHILALLYVEIPCINYKLL